MLSSRLPLCCPNCNKQYTRQACYDKHKLLCCNNISLDISGVTIETCKKPSLLIQTVEELIKSNNILKTEIAELKRKAQTQKKKIPIIDILNKTYTQTEECVDYLDVKVCRTDLEVIFLHDLITGIQEIIQNQITSVEDTECPIQAFDQKENKIYGYTKKLGWQLITKEIFSKIISKIIKSIMNEFKVWQDEHTDELYTEDFSLIYVKNVKKVMGGNTSHDKMCTKIYNNIYKFIKKPLNSVEYSIE